MTIPSCPVCGSDELQVFHRRDAVPVLCNALHTSAEEALAAPSGAVHLARCQRCAMVWNHAFDPAALAYDARYENSLRFSPVFQDFATALAARLAARVPERGTVVELGCGQGDFLELLCQRPDLQGIGIDPGYRGPVERSAQLRFVVGSWDAAGADIEADLVCARHVLEHLDRPDTLLRASASLLRDAPDAIAYVEVPDAAYMFDRAAVWDVLFEHTLYFTDRSLRCLAERVGLGVSASGTAFGGQYLWMECGPRAPSAPIRAAARGPVTEEDVRTFDRLATRIVDRCAAFLADASAAGLRTALWGTGSKGTTFLNTVPGASDIELVVDVNPRKHGLHVPGTGQQVRDPTALREERIDQVLVLNPNYRAEIGLALEHLGVPARVVTA